MPEDEKQQEIVKDYIEAEKNNKLKQCIYEEKTSGDNVEWFFDVENWCYFEEKEVRDTFSEEYNKEIKTGGTGKQYKTVYKLISKRHKTFNKNCTILDLSFKNYMLWNYHKFKNIDEIDNEEIELYISKYLKWKNAQDNFSIEAFNNFLIQEQKENELRAKAEILGCFGWFLTIIFLFIPSLRIFILFVCPPLNKLLYKYIILKIKKAPSN